MRYNLYGMSLLKKYSTEFLVVFIAVFSGTLAENLREQYQERKQGREYIERFYKDLKSDLVEIDRIVELTERKTNRLQALDGLRETKPLSMGDYVNIYGQIRNADIWENLIYLPNNITIEQIKSTGAWNFILREQADIITSYELSLNKILMENDLLLLDVRHTFDLIKKTPNDTINYSRKDFDQRELQNLFNYVHNLYWAHVAYARTLNRHKYFVQELLHELEVNYGVELQSGAYTRMSSRISIVKIISGSPSEDDIFLFQETDDPLVWSRIIDLDAGEFRFRKGGFWEVNWATDAISNGESLSGKAIQNGTNNLSIPNGTYQVTLDLNDTTYTIKQNW